MLLYCFIYICVYLNIFGSPFLLAYSNLLIANEVFQQLSFEVLTFHVAVLELLLNY